ncbi:MAG TPA: 23S rRNA (uracil(1939)-C(5))-methyltransferase RlmD [Chitinophagaceae bacterium]
MRKRKNVVLERVKVEDYAAEGKALARIDGKVIFIENTVPGDVVDVRLFRNKKDWAEGFPVRFHEYSTNRIEPFCPHFGVCGGCQWQMLPYELQLQYKQRQVEENLKRIGHVTLPPVQPIIGAAETRFYRNKLEYTFSNRRFLLESELADPGISANADVAGFHARGIFDKIIDIRECFLQPEPSNRLRDVIREFGLSHGLSFYDIRAHHGFLRNVQIRICTTGEVMVNVILGPGSDPRQDEENRKALLDHILESVEGITTLLYTINPKWNDSITGLEPVTYSGSGYVLEKMEDCVFKIGPKSFFQTNTRQGEQLYRVARDFAELTGDQTVYDLYCGTGSIGIFLGQASKSVTGVELVPDAIADAIENARLNKLENRARFYSGDVVEICNDDFFQAHGRPDVILTDPPRAGMHGSLVKKILEIQAPLVVYVSCNPATQARDLRLLDERYAVAAVQPVDMFPHTHHIENVVQLRLKS